MVRIECNSIEGTLSCKADPFGTRLEVELNNMKGYEDISTSGNDLIDVDIIDDNNNYAHAVVCVYYGSLSDLMEMEEDGLLSWTQFDRDNVIPIFEASDTERHIVSYRMLNKDKQTEKQKKLIEIFDIYHKEIVKLLFQNGTGAFVLE